MTLDNGKINIVYTVVRVNGEGALRRRFMDMGITKGIDIKISKFAPLQDPMEIELRGYKLSLRKQDAKIIEVSANVG